MHSKTRFPPIECGSVLSRKGERARGREREDPFHFPRRGVPPFCWSFHARIPINGITLAEEFSNVFRGLENFPAARGPVWIKRYSLGWYLHRTDSNKMAARDRNFRHRWLRISRNPLYLFPFAFLRISLLWNHSSISNTLFVTMRLNEELYGEEGER